MGDETPIALPKSKILLRMSVPREDHTNSVFSSFEITGGKMR
jgi:hypothetical protein